MAFKQCSKPLWEFEPRTYGVFSKELDDIDSCPLTTKEDILQLCSSLQKVMKDTSSTTITTTTNAIDSSLEFFKRIKGRVIASNNGLFVCTTPTTIDDEYSIKPTKLFLCNPATQTCWLDIQLPNKGIAENNYNVIFTCSDSSSFSSNNESFPFDYTLLLTELDTSKDWSDEWKVYILEEDKWVMKETNLNAGGRNLNWTSPVSCKSSLYFISDCSNYVKPGNTYYWPYVLRYDICHGTSTVLPLPDEARENFIYSNMSIFGWQKIRSEPNNTFNSICLVKCIKSRIWVWVLGDTKDPSSWWRLLEVDIVEDMGIKDSISWPNIRFIITGKNLIFTTDSYVYKYVLEGKYGGELQVICPNSRSYSRLR